MPPPRRRPATPSARRPKVAGLHRRPDSPEQDTPELETPELETPELETPVIDAEPEPEPKPASRPRPQPKHRDTGSVTAAPAEPRVSPRARRRQDPAPLLPEPAPLSESESESEQPKTPVHIVVDPELDPASGPVVVLADGQAEPESPNLWLPIALVVAALVVAGLGYWFSVEAADAKVGSGNAAQVDVNGTKDLVGAAQQAVAGVLSYKFDEMDKSTSVAKQYLAGEAIGQYDKSMQALASEIQNQKLQVAVNPVKIGVVRLAGDEARVLVFADQVGVRADKQPSGGPTQFAMDMHRTDGKWKIVKLDFFDGK